jgi:tetratricopeptide (TPR) repeat protein
MVVLSTFPVSVALANDQTFNRGIESGNRMQWQKAASQFTTVLKHDPDNADAYYRRALCYVNMKDDASAIRDLSKGISMRPEPELLFLRGSIFRRVGLLSEAIEDYSQAISHLCFDTYVRASQPQALLGDAYFRRGEIKSQMGDHEEASRDFKIALGLNPELQSVVEQYQMSIPAAMSHEAGAVVDVGEFLYQSDKSAVADAVKLSALEVKLFGRPYGHELIDYRVTRLERFVFGTVKEQIALSERITQLSNFVQPERIDTALNSSR